MLDQWGFCHRNGSFVKGPIKESGARVDTHLPGRGKTHVPTTRSSRSRPGQQLSSGHRLGDMLSGWPLDPNSPFFSKDGNQLPHASFHLSCSEEPKHLCCLFMWIAECKWNRPVALWEKLGEVIPSLRGLSHPVFATTTAPQWRASVGEELPVTEDHVQLFSISRSQPLMVLLGFI
jgi:hypothetical protein